MSNYIIKPQSTGYFARRVSFSGTRAAVLYSLPHKGTEKAVAVETRVIDVETGLERTLKTIR